MYPSAHRASNKKSSPNFLWLTLYLSLCQPWKPIYISSTEIDWLVLIPYFSTRIMCLISVYSFQMGWEVYDGVGSKGLQHAKKVLNYLWRVTPALPNILLHRLDPFTGSSWGELNFISICGAREIPWSIYNPKCAIISFFVKYSNPLYLPPLLPEFVIISFLFVQYWNYSIVTALGYVFWCAIWERQY